jgi:hypothetical protein
MSVFEVSNSSIRGAAQPNAVEELSCSLASSNKTTRTSPLSPVKSRQLTSEGLDLAAELRIHYTNAQVLAKDSRYAAQRHDIRNQRSTAANLAPASAKPQALGARMFLPERWLEIRRWR